MTKNSSITYNITAISISVAVITISSWIHIPFIISVTLQSLAIFLIAALLPPRISIGGVSVYLVLGAMGIPIFSGFSGGASSFLGASGGFLLSFLPITVLISIFRKKYCIKLYVYPIILSISTLISYALGSIWYMYIFCYSSNVSFFSAISVCVLPFIAFDTVKILLSTLLFKNLNPYFKRLPL